jgi:hypothetical protein
MSQLAQRVARRFLAEEKEDHVLFFVSREIAKARLEIIRLSQLVEAGRNFIDQSEARDHFYEVAGHLIKAVPECVEEIGDSVNAASMAMAVLEKPLVRRRTDPLKTKELERVIQQAKKFAPEMG